MDASTSSTSSSPDRSPWPKRTRRATSQVEGRCPLSLSVHFFCFLSLSVRWVRPTPCPLLCHLLPAACPLSAGRSCGPLDAHAASGARLLLSLSSLPSFPLLVLLFAPFLALLALSVCPAERGTRSTRPCSFAPAARRGATERWSRRSVSRSKSGEAEQRCGEAPSNLFGFVFVHIPQCWQAEPAGGKHSPRRAGSAGRSCSVSGHALSKAWPVVGD